MHLVFLVHGTWGRSESAWYHATCAPTSFAAKLKTALGERSVDPNDVIFVPFEWTGGNTHSDRLEGAASLASKLIELRGQYADARFHFVAHSHGGNVVLKALEIYLHDLPFADVPKMFDTPDIVDVSQRFLQDYADGKYRFHPPTDEIDKLLRQLADTLERISQRGSKRWRVSITDDDPMWDFEKSSLRQPLVKFFHHVYTLPENHRIGSVITLGTPFYEKHWRLTQATKMINWLLHVLSFVPLTTVSIYICIVLGGVLAAITPWVSWIGFNPLNWHWLLWAIGGVFSLWGAVSSAKSDDPELPRDTNVYFDEAEIPYYVRILEPIKLCRLLNIHASYLDEAYCLLSAYPLLSEAITKRFAQAALPRFWDFKEPSGDVGFWRGSPPAVMHRNLKRLTRLAIALAKAIAYPSRLIVHRLSTRYVARLVGKDLRVLGYGLPPDESPRSSVVTVEKVLHKPYFDTHSLDVSRVLAVLRVRGVDGEDRFEFLWNDDDLARRVEDSVLVKTLGDPRNSDHYRQLVALEERAREFFGVVGLRHSMYYDNDVVINGIADFVTGRVPVV